MPPREGAPGSRQASDRSECLSSRFARTSYARYAATRQTTSHAASVVLPRRIRARREQKTILLSARKYERNWRTRRDSNRSEEHTSELQSLLRISYAVFC